MENPTNLKVIGTWIWTTLQEVYTFLKKPFSGIFLLLPSIGWAWYVSSSKFQEGYNAGTKNQIESNQINTSNLKTQIKDLQAEKKTLQVEKQSLQNTIDTMKNPDCMEITNKFFDYVDSVEKRIDKKTQQKAQRLQEKQKEIQTIKQENKQYENLINKNKRQ